MDFTVQSMESTFPFRIKVEVGKVNFQNSTTIQTFMDQLTTDPVPMSFAFFFSSLELGYGALF